MLAEPEFLSVPEAAALLRIGERTTYKLVHRGELPALKLGGQWRIHRPTLLAWADGRKDCDLRPDVGEAQPE